MPCETEREAALGQLLSSVRDGHEGGTLGAATRAANLATIDGEPLAREDTSSDHLSPGALSGDGRLPDGLRRDRSGR